MCYAGRPLLVSFHESEPCCCCSHINSHNQVRGHRTGSSHSGAEEYPRGKHKQLKGGTRIYHSWRNSCLHQKHITVKSRVSLRCARSILVHTPHYSRLKNRLYRLPPKKDYHVYIARSICHYAYARQTQVNWKKETKNK